MMKEQRTSTYRMSLAPCIQEMEQDVSDFYKRLEESGIEPRHTHRLTSDQQWDLNEFYRTAAQGWRQVFVTIFVVSIVGEATLFLLVCHVDFLVLTGPVFGKWRKGLYSVTGEHRRRYSDSYRDRPLEGGEDWPAKALEEKDNVLEWERSGRPVVVAKMN